MLQKFFNNILYEFETIAPKAFAAYELLDPSFSNIDHVAFRAFNIGPHTLDTLGQKLIEMGYEPTSNYNFTNKHVRATSFSLERDEGLSLFVPRIFLSEILVEELSPASQQIIKNIVKDIYSWPGRNFCTMSTLLKNEYNQLLSESEYAAWVALNGLVPNHMTVNVSERITDVVAKLEANGFEISDVGGKIKGGPEVLLEQASTVADKITCVDPNDWSEFFYGTTAYCEFAYRWTDPATGKPFDKFVEPSANNIFHSTDVLK